MKQFLLVLVFFICLANSYGQTATNTYGNVEVEITKENRKKIYANVEIKRAFLGGDSSWVQSIETKLNQSNQLGKGAKKGKYLVLVQFIVDKDGIISDVKALTSNGYGMEEQVLYAIKRKSKWLPAPQGIPVKPYRTSLTTPTNQ